MKLALTLGIFQVPVIAVFTKYEHLRYDVEGRLANDPHLEIERDYLRLEIERVFNQDYLANLKGPPPYIRLESEVSVTV